MIGVQPHLLAFAAGQRARLRPYPGRDGDPADVVHQRRPAQPGRLRRAQPGGPGCRPGQVGDTAGVPDRPHAFQVREVRHRRQAGIHLVLADHRLRPRLGGQRLLPDRRRIQARVYLVAEGQEDGRDLRVQPRPGPSPHSAPGQRGTTALPGDIRVLRHLHHPHRQRDLLAAQVPRQPLAVPALVQVPQRGLNLLRQAHPRAQQLRDLAMTGGPPAELRQAANGGPGHRRRPRGGGLPGWAARAAVATSPNRDPYSAAISCGRTASSSPRNRTSISLPAVHPAKCSIPV